jgi:hypothetical protein
MHSCHELRWGKPGNANLPIGAWQYANREIGVPGKHTIPWATRDKCDLMISDSWKIKR